MQQFFTLFFLETYISDQSGDEWSDKCSAVSDVSEIQPVEKPAANFYSEDELFPGCPMNVTEFILSLAAIKVAHKPTDACLSDFLRLICDLSVKPHNCPTSLHKFQKFFSELNIPLKKHYYCSNCTTLVTNTDNDVNNDEVIENEESLAIDNFCYCNENVKEENYFIELPLIDQLESMYVRKGFYKILSSRLDVINCEQNTYNDIYDGKVYSELTKKKQHFIK